MSLAELRAKLAGEEPAVSEEAGVAPATEEEPWGVAQVVTPSGLEIYYQAGPKRLYRIRSTTYGDGTGQVVGAPWHEVISVSTVLEVLDKGGLSWWGMKVGIAGALQTVGEYDITRALNDPELLDLDGAFIQEIVDRLTAKKLTVNHTKDKAATRGTNVHTALERYAENGVIPDPQFWPENERGYVEGLVAFLKDAKPKILLSEVMVASADGWAGRFDCTAELDAEVAVRCYPKKKSKMERVSGRWLLDLKTSKGVYESYKIQVGAYRQGLLECGYGEVDHAGVLRVTPDGKYELVEAVDREGNEVTYEDFLSVFDTNAVVKRLS